ncbi:COG2958 family protein [Phytobacter sp. V91]|uniref:COG2958 family protein n=1 Tax=Phytobacter sp. V91 TaxID=3369425 RepID=UPI003F63F342
MNNLEDTISAGSKNNTLSGMVISVLKENQKTQFTARELAVEICKRYTTYAKNKLESSGKLTGENDLIGQVAAEIGSQKPLLMKKNQHIKTSAGKPRKYYWVQDISQADQDEINLLPKDENDFQDSHSGDYSEHDLYPLLSNYASSTLGVYTRRIDEKKSRKGPFKSNKWIHPDIVGIQDNGQHWGVLAKDIVSNFGGKRAFLWSFEVKKTLNISNVREAFFQTVSNSSWSHYGYIVAENIDDKCISELTVLNAVHGIGVILLDVINPAESQILIHAKEKLEIDWETCNRLIELNPDFREYMDLIKEFLLNGKVKPTEWGICNEK